MVKVTYRLKTLSSLVASPRASLALYRTLEQFKPEEIPKELREKCKVIYPFYQVGTYEKYDKDNACYYLPGSSVKGALRRGQTGPLKLMVDDIPVANTATALKTLQKVQYLKSESQAPCLAAFFENVGVEMVKAGTELTGEAYVDRTDTFTDLLAETHQAAKAKMQQMLDYWAELEHSLGDNSKELKVKLQKAGGKLEACMQEPGVILLGGFKGLLHSILRQTQTEDIDKGAIFLDPDTDLPHGIVQITLG